MTRKTSEMRFGRKLMIFLSQAKTLDLLTVRSPGLLPWGGNSNKILPVQYKYLMEQYFMSTHS